MQPASSCSFLLQVRDKTTKRCLEQILVGVLLGVE
jgi:hypothetical protein